MLERFRAYVAKHRLIPDGARVLVGYSGGADSTCLLHLLHRAKVDVVAAYLHHGQRPEAESELVACREFAERLGLPFVSGEADVPRIAKEHKIGIEEAGREARYAFFEDAARQTDCTQIATAHTRSDLAETVLLNLVRGSGLGGLAGIPVQRRNIIRPLLFASRSETVGYCHEQGLEYTSDRTNEDLRYARPRLRQKVMPELEAINGAYEANIARLADIAEEEDRFLDSAAAAALEQCELPLNGPLRFLTLDAELMLSRPGLRHLPPVLLKRALRLVAEALGGKLDHSTTQNLARDLLIGESGSFTSQEGRVVFSWKSQSLHVWREEESDSFREVLRLPGDTFRDAHNWKLSAGPAEAPTETLGRSSLECYMDLDGSRGPLHFRTVQPGDRMYPLGGRGHRKLSDLMSEAGLTLLARQRLPIICDIIGPIWAPGVMLDERVRLSPSANKALRMVFAPISRGPAESETLSGV